MRETKFKVWDKVHKRMDEVRDLDLQHKRYQRSGSIHGTEWKHYEELLYFTGLKLKNKEVYDGDIVTCQEIWIDKKSKEVIEENPANLQVCFQNYEWVFVGRVFVPDGYNMIRLKFSDYREDMSWGSGFENYNKDFHAITKYIDFEIIGNTNKNPELLGENKS